MNEKGNNSNYLAEKRNIEKSPEFRLKEKFNKKDIEKFCMNFLKSKNIFWGDKT